MTNQNHNTETGVNKKAMREWVYALLSGDYEQGYGCLEYNQKFCCLGVASDLFYKEVGLVKGDRFGFVHYREPENKYMETSVSLANKIVDYLGIKTRDPQLEINGKIQSASLWNDGTDRSPGSTEKGQNSVDFKTIAKALNDKYKLGIDIKV